MVTTIKIKFVKISRFSIIFPNLQETHCEILKMTLVLYQLHSILYAERMPRLW